MTLYIQGDVLLKPIAFVPKEARKKDLILLRGEVTGHCHQFLDALSVVVTELDSRQFVELFQPAPLVHEEHGTLQIPKGKYEVIRQREVDLSEEIRKVTD